MYKEQFIGVLGLGRTGLSVVASALASGAEVFGWDDSKKVRIAAKKKFPEMSVQPPSSKKWLDISLLVPSPGISDAHALIKKVKFYHRRCHGDLELLNMQIKKSGMFDSEIVAITGTNGKSTTTALTTHVLQYAGFDAVMGGNIGIPFLSLPPLQSRSIYVLEISSYQAKDLTEFGTKISVLLNLAQDHIERHGSMAAYAEAKKRIFKQVEKDGLAIINTEEPFSLELAEEVAENNVVVRLEEVDISFLGSLAAHQKNNIAASWAIARYFGISKAVFVAALKSFQPLPHRVETVAQIGDVRYVNDSKATNPAAACHALNLYGKTEGKDIYWIAGGALKKGGLMELNDSLKPVRHAYLFGDAAKPLSKFLGDRVPWSIHKNLRGATEAASRDAKAGVVLLSPACASFDAFTDFAERGHAFATNVRAAIGKPRIFIAAGGTGGGLFPAQALTQELQKRGYHCTLLHDKRAVAYIKPHIWDRHYQIASGAIAGRPVFFWPFSIMAMSVGFLKAFFILLFTRAPIMIGFGGYPSLPSALAAWVLRVPLIIHEPGGVLGRANKFLAPLAKIVALSAPSEQARDKFKHTGNPVRADLRQWRDMPYRSHEQGQPFKITIFAGSQGAIWFDDVVSKAVAILSDTGVKLKIVQQCRSQRQEIENLYQKKNIQAETAEFFDDLPRHIAQSQLVITRGGASTISELALLGRPAIIIPLGAAPEKEQNQNAEKLARVNAAWVLQQERLSAQTLAQQIEKLVKQPLMLCQAAHAAHQLGDVKAHRRLADLVESLRK